MNQGRRSPEGIGLAALAAVGLALTWFAYQPILDNYFVGDDFSYLNVGRQVLAQPSLLLDQPALLRIYTGAVMRPVGDAIWAGLVACCGYEARPYYLLGIALHLLNALLAGLVLRRWCGDRLVAVLGAVLFATAYGVRNGVVWISNYNESFVLTLQLGLWLLLTSERVADGQRPPRWLPWTVGGGLLLGCLIKESVAPVVAPLVLFDSLRRPRPVRSALAWWPALALVAGYMLFRMSLKFEGAYDTSGFGPHTLVSWPALVASCFGSNLLPIFLSRALQAPELVPLVGWTAVALLAWLTLRGPRLARPAALWVLVQELPYALVPATRPENLQSHYLYCATVPAMALLALGWTALARRGRWPTTLLALLLAWLLAHWTWYGVRRNRADEADHWEVASQTLRRDFAVLDAAGLAPGTRIVLVLPAEQAPGGLSWWGWEGYPVVSRVPLSLERVLTVPDPATLTPPVVVYTYDQTRGPQLLLRRDAGP
ncbi:MAG: hypothetical protein IT204_01270 [Fimbriimonadaceae bacterium]|nr:hypothetical protein [Fimbriimonadaceae bacterium]